MILINTIFTQATCSWWFLFAFDNPLRKLYQDPVKKTSHHTSIKAIRLWIWAAVWVILHPTGQAGWRAWSGYCVDLRPRLLEGLYRRAEMDSLLVRKEI